MDTKWDTVRGTGLMPMLRRDWAGDGVEGLLVWNDE